MISVTQKLVSVVPQLTLKSPITCSIVLFYGLVIAVNLRSVIIRKWLYKYIFKQHHLILSISTTKRLQDCKIKQGKNNFAQCTCSIFDFLNVENDKFFVWLDLSLDNSTVVKGTNWWYWKSRYKVWKLSWLCCSHFSQLCLYARPYLNILIRIHTNNI